MPREEFRGIVRLDASELVGMSLSSRENAFVGYPKNACFESGAFGRVAWPEPDMKQANTRLAEKLVVNPLPVARRLLWHPYSLDTACLDKPDYHEAFEKPGAHLFWVVSGRGTLKTQGRQYRLHAGNHVWFIDMMEPRTYAPDPGQRLIKRGFRFGGPGMETWHEQLGGNFKAEFIMDDASSVHQAYGEILRLVRSKAPGWEWQVQLTLNRVLGLLLAARGLLSPDHVELPPPVLRVLNAIASNPFHDWKVKDLSAIARVSYSGLRTLFQASQHESLHACILRTRLGHARLLLADPQLSLKQIAEQLNFSSEFYFSHFFKRYEGMCPTQYRSRLKAKR